MFCHHVDQLLHLGFQAQPVVVDGEGVVLPPWLLDGEDCVAALLGSSLLRERQLVLRLTSSLTLLSIFVVVVRILVKVFREKFVKEEVVGAVRKKTVLVSSRPTALYGQTRTRPGPARSSR